MLEKRSNLGGEWSGVLLEPPHGLESNLALNQEHVGVAMANQQLRQMHREANAAILLERISFDSGNIQNCRTRPARSRTAKNTRTPMLSATSLLLNALRALSAESKILWGAAQNFGVDGRGQWRSL